MVSSSWGSSTASVNGGSACGSRGLSAPFSSNYGISNLLQALISPTPPHHFNFNLSHKKVCTTICLFFFKSRVLYGLNMRKWRCGPLGSGILRNVKRRTSNSLSFFSLPPLTSLDIFDPDAQDWASECSEITQRLNPVWLYSCTHVVTMGVKGFSCILGIT